MMHVKLFIILSIITAGRPKHVLELTWSRVDLARRIINLDDPNRFKTQKGRARVPINDTGFIHLETASKVRTTDFVIEVDGKAIKSIRRGVNAAAKRAGLEGVSQYTLRHTAGVYMAQAGVPMEQIAEFMGHTSIATTRKHYARFHHDYLRAAASALEIDFIRSTAGSLVPPTVNETTPKDEEKQHLPIAREA
jgi:integrase